jgi:hypothetical protein
VTSEPILLPWLAAAFLFGLVLGIGATALFGRSQARRLMAVMGEAERRHEETLDELRKLYGLRRATVDRAMAGIEAVLDGDSAGVPSACAEAETSGATARTTQSANSASLSGGSAPISE